MGAFRRIGETHSTLGWKMLKRRNEWLKPAPFWSTSWKVVVRKKMETSGFTKILKVVGRDAAMQPVAKEANHWMSWLPSHHWECLGSTMHSDTNDMWVQHVVLHVGLTFELICNVLACSFFPHAVQCARCTWASKRFLVSWSSSRSRLARCSSPQSPWELWGKSNCLHLKFGWH